MKKLFSFLCCCLLMGSLAAPALAVDNYSFSTANPEEFYQTGVTTYTYDGQIPGYVQELYDFTPKTIYTSEYGATVIAPELNTGYGLGSSKPANAPGSSAAQSSVSATGAAFGTIDGTSGAAAYPDFAGQTSQQTAAQYALTPVEAVRQADGSIGTLKIPAIGLTVTAYDGEVTAAMKKGVAHIDSTSAWNGNIGICGHNRGVTLHFGKLKSLQPGDEINYTTSLGSRTYVVTTVQKIAANDWSLLQYTADNRITLITCVEEQPEYRLAVQAVQKN